ncbi:hypothetical protein KO525_13695 [Psychrosphaera sp. B3R10]|uniref:hypothetical protein n=1 Tax=unclassified Psychrosphaera TaxID=2641570 RepID=UPI001C095D45|nr:MULTISPECIES: hypothetical protein [unclassified Psychrosphaera]MBU2882064.1 hypothetical protein [Psychrosphaera sp. I2R16]MBU2990436.1 hypothetical protein [Psychrosphaera sp. B3R10]
MTHTTLVGSRLKQACCRFIIICMSLIPAAQASVTLDVLSDDIQVGDYFLVNVILENTEHKSISSFAFDYNDAALQQLEFTGDELTEPRFSRIEEYATVDNLVISPERVNEQNTLLATLKFYAHSTGKVTLSLLGNDGELSGVFFTDLTYESIDANVSFVVNDKVESLPDTDNSSGGSLTGLLILCLFGVRIVRARY